MHYYLRLEAVNINGVLGDTNQLSVIRGSGLMLREAAQKIEAILNSISTEITVCAVSTGASAGLYTVDAARDGDAQRVLEAAQDWLCTEYPDMTFVVDLAEGNRDEFLKAQAQLVNQNRYRQLQQLSLSTVGLDAATVAPDSKDSPVTCRIDGIRPISDKTFRDSRVSESVYRRFERGRVLRQQFIREELGITDGDPTRFTDDLQALARSDRYGVSGNKLAVLYFDGNGFGDIQRKYCKTSDLRGQFDDVVRTGQRAFLRSLVEQAKNDDGFETDSGEIRLEVLMWGGDELRIVVPAWRGLWTLHRFFETVDGSRFPENLSDTESDPLTYAGGIVFSQANTPIQRLTQVADALADQVKSLKQTVNAFDYLVLESLDYPTESLSDLRRRLYPDRHESRVPLQPVNLAQWHQLQSLISAGVIAKSPIVEMAETALSETEQIRTDREKRIEQLIQERSPENADGQVEALKELLSSIQLGFGSLKAIDTLSDRLHVWPWVSLATLWDYLFAGEQEGVRYVES